MTLTRLLVVSDLARSRTWYETVLGAEVQGEYGGTSCVLGFLVEYPWEIRAFFRDPDGHLFEISERRGDPP